MSIQTVSCPGCSQSISIPPSMTNVRCPKCGTIWNVANPGAAKLPPGRQPGPSAPDDENRASKSDPNHKVAFYVVTGTVMTVIMLLFLFGLATLLGRAVASPKQEVAVEEETIEPRIPEPYREVDLPEVKRRGIYDDYRKVARTSVEAPLLLPDSQARSSVEATLQATFDREIRRFAALHDVPEADIREIIKEGDAKRWDPSPRSNARRGGKRVYSEEMSKNWKGKPILP